MNELIQPDGDDHAGSARPEAAAGARSAQAGAGRARARRPILSAQQCLEALSSLGGLLVMGTITPAQANALRATYREITQYHRAQQEEARAASPGLSDSDAAALLRLSPEVLALLEPLLSEEQIAALLRRQDGSDA